MKKRVCVMMDEAEWVKFKMKASQKYKFTKGYTTASLAEAVHVWYCLNYVHEGRGRLLEIAKKKHPNFNKEELVKSIFDECEELYLKKNKNYL